MNAETMRAEIRKSLPELSPSAIRTLHSTIKAINETIHWCPNASWDQAWFELRFYPGCGSKFFGSAVNNRTRVTCKNCIRMMTVDRPRTFKQFCVREKPKMIRKGWRSKFINGLERWYHSKLPGLIFEFVRALEIHYFKKYQGTKLYS